MSKKLHIEVCYGLADEQKLIPLEVTEGTSVVEAVLESGIQQLFPEMDISNLKLGIYNLVVENESLVKEADRIEIYRPLLADPKEVRKRRAAEMKAKRAAQKQGKSNH